MENTNRGGRVKREPSSVRDLRPQDGAGVSCRLALGELFERGGLVIQRPLELAGFPAEEKQCASAEEGETGDETEADL